MDAGFLFIQALNGLAGGSSLFLASVGLSIIFGVTRVVNFAHGSLYMLGAYAAYSLAAALMASLPAALGFWAAVLLAAVLVGLFGALIEIVLLRRIYHTPELFQLLLTFGLVLIVNDAVRYLWGPQDLLGPRAPGLDGAVSLFGHRFPEYELFLVVLGPLVLAGLWLLFHLTRFGVLVRAATEDREMVGALGVDERGLFTAVFFIGAGLAGLAGALQLPREAANLNMDLSIVVEAFVVTVIGGMGSVTGAFLAAILIGELQAFGILFFPKITIVLAFLVMALVLILRPQGLLGRIETTSASTRLPDMPPAPGGRWLQAIYALLLLLLLAAPALVDSYSLRLLTDALVYALLAASLGFLMGTGGVISFGHAAYFGLGAYGAALLVHHLSAPMTLALAAAPLAAAMGAAVFGWLCVRLSGVYLAMLTLAFAQIVYAVAFQWIEVTGGDNGLIGIWPARWAADPRVFYYLSLSMCLAGIVLLYRAAFSPFGYGLRAVRDSRVRAESIGIDARRQQWLAFIIAGAAAGLAGGVHVFSRGNVDPSVTSVTTSVDALTMVLLGGVQTVTGPLAGAAALTYLKDWVMPLTDYWRLLMGAVIVVLVLLFRQGLIGSAHSLLARMSARP